MVVYEGGRPRRNDYRKFKIRTVQGPNDYASMEEVLTRRFEHGLSEREELMAMETADGDPGNMERFGSFTRFPDLIMMDGGRGQVNVALKVLERLGLSSRSAAWSRTITTGPGASITRMWRSPLTGTARALS